MKLISLSAVTALLGACASAPSDPVGSAAFNSAPFNYTVTQGGTNYTLLSSAPRAIETAGGISFYNWSPSGTLTSGFAMASSANYTVAAGLDNGTYFAGVSGTLNGGLPVAGTASLTGGYAFVVNGVDLTGPLTLIADFGAGTIVDSSTAMYLNGTISGGKISGTVIVGGETGDLGGGFYTYIGGYRLVGAGVGENMAGILRVQ